MIEGSSSSSAAKQISSLASTQTLLWDQLWQLHVSLMRRSYILFFHFFNSQMERSNRSQADSKHSRSNKETVVEQMTALKLMQMIEASNVRLQIIQRTSKGGPAIVQQYPSNDLESILSENIQSQALTERSEKILKAYGPEFNQLLRLIGSKQKSFFDRFLKDYAYADRHFIETHIRKR